MDVLVISLPSADARRRNITRMLQSAGMHQQATLIDAVDGSDMYESDIEQQATRFCSSFCTPSMIGCFISHRKAWQHVVDHDLPMALVLEDDASFSVDLMGNVGLLLQEAPNDFDMILLGCYQFCNTKDNSEVGKFEKLWTSILSGRPARRALPHSEHLDVPGYFSGLHAYIITRKGASRLLARLPKASFHVDAAIAMRPSGLRIFSSNPSLVTQEQSVSSSSIASKAPYIINTLCDHIDVNTRGTTLAYVLSEPFARVPGVDYTVNAYSLLYFTVLFVGTLAFPSLLFVLLVSLARTLWGISSVARVLAL